MGRRRKRVRQEGLWTATAALPVGASHPFYQRLNQILDEKKFDEGLLLKDGSRTSKGIWGGGGPGAPGLEGAKQGVINAQRLLAVQGVDVYLMTHSWQPPDGYPGGGILERAKLLATRKPGDPHPFVDPASLKARAQQSLETAQRVLAEEQAKAANSK